MTTRPLLTDEEIRKAGEGHARECWRGGSRNYRSLAVDCREDFLSGANFARSIYEADRAKLLARYDEAIRLLREAGGILTDATHTKETFWLEEMWGTNKEVAGEIEAFLATEPKGDEG